MTEMKKKTFPFPSLTIAINIQQKLSYHKLNIIFSSKLILNSQDIFVNIKDKIPITSAKRTENFGYVLENIQKPLEILQAVNHKKI